MKVKDVKAGTKYLTRTGLIVEALHPSSIRGEWVVRYETGHPSTTGTGIRSIPSSKIKEPFNAPGD